MQQTTVVRLSRQLRHRSGSGVMLDCEVLLDGLAYFFPVVVLAEPAV